MQLYIFNSLFLPFHFYISSVSTLYLSHLNCTFLSFQLNISTVSTLDFQFLRNICTECSSCWSSDQFNATMIVFAFRHQKKTMIVFAFRGRKTPNFSSTELKIPRPVITSVSYPSRFVMIYFNWRIYRQAGTKLSTTFQFFSHAYYLVTKIWRWFFSILIFQGGE